MITAESFAGRVIAVFSRRAPGFRPPPGQPPSPTSAARIQLVLDQRVRVRSRADKQRRSGIRWRNVGASYSRGIETPLTPIADSALRLWDWGNADRLSARKLILDVEHSLTEARDAALALNRGLKQLSQARGNQFHPLALAWGDREAGEELARDVMQASAAARSHARDLQVRLDQILSLVRPTALAIVLEPALADYSQNLAAPLTRSGSDQHDITIALASDLSHDLTSAHEIFVQLGSDFQGADLRDAELDSVPLTGIRWNTSTLWPTGWTDRIRRASEEVAPGVFLVRDAPSQVPAPAMG